MQGTAGRVRNDAAARVAEVASRRPEWARWLLLLGEVEQSGATLGWSLSRESGVRSREVPLLHGRTLRVNPGELRRLIGRLVRKASELEGGASLRRYRPGSEAAVELIAAAVRQDREAILAIAGAGGLDAGALGSVAYLAALPLLRACGRELQDRIPEYWPHGYCPICAAWPILAERRGLDRSRRLRCGRCAADWEIDWLTCVYCGERDHLRLGSLVLEESETLKVETCTSCKGYLKSIASLQAIPPFELLLQDLETVELDLVARERQYGRPEGNGYRLEVRLV